MDKDEMARRCGDAMWANDKASHALGIEIEVTTAGSASATMRIRDDMVNGLDVCHGGLLVALADTAFAFACNAYNTVTVAASVQCEFLRPARLGDELSALAMEDHRGRRSGHYTVRTHNQDGALVMLFRGRSASTDKPILSN